MADKLPQIVLDVLKRALAEPGETRLFRSGKLPGLFASRVGMHGEAATFALQENLLEMVRTEPKGKLVVEWVRITPKGIEYVHSHESPRAVLADVRAALEVAQNGVPAWLEAVRTDWLAQMDRLQAQVQRYVQELEALRRRVDEALRRADALAPELAPGVAQLVPWGLDALTYLDRRKYSGAGADCPLPELFTRLRADYPELSLSAFHDGLSRLRDNRALLLLPHHGPLDQLPEPEFALLDGPRCLYYATR